VLMSMVKEALITSDLSSLECSVQIKGFRQSIPYLDESVLENKPKKLAGAGRVGSMVEADLTTSVTARGCLGAVAPAAPPRECQRVCLCCSHQGAPVVRRPLQA
jgi:hypothetical protein